MLMVVVVVSGYSSTFGHFDFVGAASVALRFFGGEVDEVDEVDESSNILS